MLSRDGSTLEDNVTIGMSPHHVLAIFQGIAAPHCRAGYCIQIWHSTNQQVVGIGFSTDYDNLLTGSTVFGSKNICARSLVNGWHGDQLDGNSNLSAVPYDDYIDWFVHCSQPYQLDEVLVVLNLQTIKFENYVAVP